MPKRALRRTFKAAVLILCMSAVVVSIAAVAILFKIHISNEWQQHVSMPVARIPHKGDSIMVFAPHSDDETLGCGGMLAYAARKGAKVHVVLVTNGDGFVFAAMRAYRSMRITPERYIEFAYRRQRETLSALRTLGVPKTDVTFLGYPDRGTARMWDTYWGADRLYTSPITGADHSPYRNSFTYNAPYCGESLLGDIERVLKQDMPTDVYLPHPSDNHPDHYATYCFVTAAIEQLRSEGYDFAKKIRAHTYIVHRGDWPTPKGDHPSESLAPPFALAQSDTKWYTLALSRDIAAMKRRAIQKYRTQTAVEHGFMLSFARSNEIYGNLPNRAVEQVKPGTIRVDGDPKDWAGIPPAVVDPVGDYLVADFSRGGDVRAIYLCTDMNYLYLRLDCVRNLSRRLTYTLNFRSLNSSDSNDWYTITLKPPAYSRPSGTKWAYKGNVLELAVPMDKLHFDSEAFVQVHTKWHRLTIDNTGWQGVEINHEAQSANRVMGDG